MSEGAEIVFIWAVIIIFAFIIDLCQKSCEKEEVAVDNDEDEWVTEDEWSETQEAQRTNTVTELREENERLKSALNQSASVPNPQSLGWCPQASTPSTSTNSQCPYPTQMPFPSQLPYPAQMPYPPIQPTPPYPLSKSSETLTASYPSAPYPHIGTAISSIAPYPTFSSLGYGSSSEQNLSKPTVPYRQNPSLERLDGPSQSQQIAPYPPELPGETRKPFTSSTKPPAPYPSSSDSRSDNLPQSVIEFIDISSAPGPLPSAPYTESSLTQDMGAPPPSFEETMKMFTNKQK